MRCGSMLAAVTLGCLLPAATAGAQRQPVATAGWQGLDVTRDGRVTGSDMRALFEGGLRSPAIDVNRDGKKDERDFPAMLLRFTQLDLNADGVLSSADDAPPPPPLSSSRSSVAGMVGLATALEREMAGRVPDTLEAAFIGRILGVRPELRRSAIAALTADERASVLARLGAAGVVEGNLDVVAYAYGRAAQVQPNAATLNNLGFALMELGRHAQAYDAFAQAIRLDGASCASHASLGVLMSRRMQHATARLHHEAAVAICPDVAQYRLNLGGTLLRLNDARGAGVQFAKAASLAPGDLDAALMNFAMAPGGSLAGSFAAGHDAERERQIRELRENGDTETEPQYPPWAETSNSSRIESIWEQVAQKVDADREREVERIKGVYRPVVRSVWDRVAPTGSACADVRRWAAQIGPTTKAAMDTYASANVALNAAELHARRRQAVQTVAAGPVILQIALAEAQEAMATGGRSAFVYVVDERYETPMRELARDAARPREYDLEFSIEDLDPDEYGRAVTLSFLPSVLGAVLNENNCEPVPPAELSRAEDEMKAGLGWGPASIEVDGSSCEVKIKVSAGLFVAGTYSPIAGTGFQAGAETDVSIGPVVLASGAGYVKYGSDGSVEVISEGSAGVGAGVDVGTVRKKPVTAGGGRNWKYSEKAVLRAATHEPIGASTFLADFFACPPAAPAAS